MTERAYLGATDAAAIQAFKAIPGISIGPDDGTQDARILRAVRIGSRAVEDVCGGRVFVPTTETRAFDAPAGAVLWVPDLVSVTTLTAAGTPLTEDTDWELLPYPGTPAPAPGARAIRRLVNTYPAAWDVSQPVWGQTPRRQISITGVWGFAEVPSLVLAATEEAAVTWWRWSLALYGPTTGNGQQGQSTNTPALLSPDTETRLKRAYGLTDPTTRRAGTLSTTPDPPVWEARA